MAYTRSGRAYQGKAKLIAIVLGAFTISDVAAFASQPSDTQTSPSIYVGRYKTALAPIYRDLGTAQAIELCHFRDSIWLSDIMTRLANEEDGRQIQYLKSKISPSELSNVAEFTGSVVTRARNYYASNNPRDLKSCLQKIDIGLINKFDLYRRGHISSVSPRPAPQSVPPSFRVQPPPPPYFPPPRQRMPVEEHHGID